MTQTDLLTQLQELWTLAQKMAASGMAWWPEMVTLDTESNPEPIPLYGYNTGMP